MYVRFRSYLPKVVFKRKQIFENQLLRTVKPFMALCNKALLRKLQHFVVRFEVQRIGRIGSCQPNSFPQWPAPGSEDTELGVLMELEVGHGETEVYAGVQA